MHSSVSSVFFFDLRNAITSTLLPRPHDFIDLRIFFHSKCWLWDIVLVFSGTLMEVTILDESVFWLGCILNLKLRTCEDIYALEIAVLKYLSDPENWVRNTPDISFLKEKKSKWNVFTSGNHWISFVPTCTQHMNGKMETCEGHMLSLIC